MYDVTPKYNAQIHASVLRYSWEGTITTTIGDVYTFESQDIELDSSSLTETGADGSALKLGAVYTSELNMSFLSLVNSGGIRVMASDIDRYVLYGAEINLTAKVRASLTPYRWSDFPSTMWSEMTDQWSDYLEYWTIPIGVYTIAEALRDLPLIKVAAYDHLSRFDKSFTPDRTARGAYVWLSLFCSACNVSLGMTAAQIYQLPNGTRSMILAAGAVDDIETYRDALSYLAAAMCCVATCDRSGALVLRTFKTTAVQDIPATWRWDCQIADYESDYDGIYATYKEDAVTEFVGDSAGTGLVYNLGVNPYLQISDSTNRAAALTAIYNKLAAADYTPFDLTAPLDPALDLLDPVTLSGNLATGELALLTEITMNMAGTMSLKGVGENPYLAGVTARYNKNIEGLLNDSTGGSTSGTAEMWMLFDNTGTAIAFTNSCDNQKLQIAYTAEFTLDAAGTATVTIYLDNTNIATYSDEFDAGTHTMSVVQGWLLDTSGDHEVNAEVTVA